MTPPVRRYPNGNLRARISKQVQAIQAMCEAQPSLGVTDRVPAVLDVLVTVYPADELSGERGLIAFPSNTRLSARACGMGRRDGTTALVSPRDAGIDGGEEQRQRETLRAPWKGRAREVEEAFDFSLALLLARSAELEALAAQRLETRTATGHQAAPDRLPT